MSPGTWPGGAWVPGGPRPCCAVCFYHDPADAQVDSLYVFSPVSFAKWASPQFENYVQIFTFSSPNDESTGPGYMNQRPASKKKHRGSHPNGDKRMNVAQFKLGRRMGTLDLIVFADATNKTNRCPPLLDSRSMVSAWCRSIQIELFFPASA